MPPGCVALQRMKKRTQVEVSLLGFVAIVHVPNPLANLIEQAGGLQKRSAGFHGKFIPVFVCSKWSCKLRRKRLAALSTT